MIINDSMLNLDKYIKPNTIDSIITDPPYELNFMGKGWDNAGVSFNKETWKKCYDVLKSGGYLLAFGGSRTYHRIACAIEDAGFEIRDCIMWLYGSGFPKSMNIGLAIDKKKGVESIDTGVASPNARPNSTKENTLFESGTVGKNFNIKVATNEWQGWGTCLKPAFEPIIVARKPFKGSLVDNVLEYGVGGLNIDECRVGDEERTYKGAGGSDITIAKGAIGSGVGKDLEFTVSGRFPANVILTYDDTDFEEVCGGFPDTKSTASKANYEKTNQNNFCHLYTNIKSGNHFEDSGSAARYFYCAKASKKDRDEGLEEFETKNAKKLLNREENSMGASWNGKYSSGNAFAGCGAPKKNFHPTVKPTSLMQYLVRLVSPKGATILDCFMGSGSTGKAVAYENKERNANYKFIGVEMNEEYCNIARARIEYAEKDKYERYNIFDFIGEE